MKKIVNCKRFGFHGILVQNCEGGGGEPEYRHGRGRAQGAGDWNPRAWQTVSGFRDTDPQYSIYE